MKLLTLQPEGKSLQLSEPEKTCTQAQSRPSVCGCCQFYEFQGHRRGYCHKLGVEVCSRWTACPLALAPFAPSWEGGITEPIFNRKFATEGI
jgi:hypothetical protein